MGRESWIEAVAAIISFYFIVTDDVFPKCPMLKVARNGNNDSFLRLGVHNDLWQSEGLNF